MPDGDTVHSAARRVGAALVGRETESIETPQPRHRLDRWPQRLAGRAVRSVDARGKHLLLRFEGDLTVHSHLRMGGSWRVYRRGERWRRSPRRAWLVLSTAEHEVVQFDGPVLELMTDGRARSDARLAALGPDILAEDFDEAAFLRRLRGDDPTRGVGDALLDQGNVAGIGNIWKSEGCHLAAIDPWRRLAELSDAEALAIVRAVRPLMRRSVERGGWPRPTRPRTVAARRGAGGAPGRTVAGACRVAHAGRRSAPAARATATVRPSGARGASTDAATGHALNASGTGPETLCARQYAGQLRPRPV